MFVKLNSNSESYFRPTLFNVWNYFWIILKSIYQQKIRYVVPLLQCTSVTPLCCTSVAPLCCTSVAPLLHLCVAPLCCTTVLHLCCTSVAMLLCVVPLLQCTSVAPLLAPLLHVYCNALLLHTHLCCMRTCVARLLAP